MARNDTDNFETEFGNRAHLRASADGWHAVASAAVAATLLVAVVGRRAVAGRRAALAIAVRDGAAISVSGIATMARGRRPSEAVLEFLRAA